MSSVTSWYPCGLASNTDTLVGAVSLAKSWLHSLLKVTPSYS